MTSYLDTYFSRINHLGTTTAERIRNSGINSFYKWMAESPHTVRHLSIERGIFFDGIILTNKDKEYTKIMFLHVANTIPLHVGDIMNWRQEDGTTEKWLILQEEKKVNGISRTFQIIRCNYLIKWIDKNGHLQQSWCYTVSSTDDKIKGNYRTWHNLISPQPNKYAEIIMPRREIDRGTNFIIEEESWSLIEYDHTSVPGVIYLSLTENKVNLIYDDLVNNIADTDKRAHYSLVLPPTTQKFVIGEPIELVYTIMKNEHPIAMRVELSSSDKTVAKPVNGVMTAIGEGSTNITLKLLDCDDIEPDELVIPIEITASEHTDFSCYIEGSDTIRLGQKNAYIICNTQDVELINVAFSVDNELVTIEKVENNSCILLANTKNKLGSIVLTAEVEYDNETYTCTKDIQVVPLW